MRHPGGLTGVRAWHVMWLVMGLMGVWAWQVKRVVMERDTYPRRWGLGPTASKKKQMKIEAAAAGDKTEKANGPEAANGA